jgi:hypothetical protein
MKMMNLGIVILTIFFVASMSLSCETSSPNSKYTILATYDYPKTNVPYQEITRSCSISIEEDDQFSEKEIEEIYNLITSIQGDPTIKKLNIQINLGKMYLSKDNNGYIGVTMGNTSGLTSGSGNRLLFHRTTRGKFELINISHWVS